MTFRHIAAVLTCGAALACSASASAEVRVWEKDPAKGDDDVPVLSVDVFGWVQPRFTWEQHDTREPKYQWEPAPGFRIRRARLGTRAELTSWASANLELDLATDQARPLDGYLTLTPMSELRVTAGQFRVPFSRQNLVSSRARQLPDPAYFVTPKFMIERDQGAMIWGELLDGRLNYYAAAFNGAGAGQQENIDPYFLIAARLEVAPLGKLPGFESDVRPVAQRIAPLVGMGIGAMNNCVQTDDLRRTYLGADVAAFWRGFSLYAEVFQRTDKTMQAKSSLTGLSGDSILGVCRRRAKAGDEPAKMNQEVVKVVGYNLQAGAFLPLRWFEDHLELVARHQSLDPNTHVSQPDSFDLTATNPTQGYQTIELGVNWFLGGLRPKAPRAGAAHNAKIQATYEIRNETKKCMAGQTEPGCTGYINNNVLIVQATGGF